MSENDTTARAAAYALIAEACERGCPIGDVDDLNLHFKASVAARFLGEEPPAPFAFVVVVVDVDARARAFTLSGGALVAAAVDLPVAGTIDVDWEEATECDPLRGGDPELQAALAAALLRIAGGADASGS